MVFLTACVGGWLCSLFVGVGRLLFIPGGVMVLLVGEGFAGLRLLVLWRQKLDVDSTASL